MRNNLRSEQEIMKNWKDEIPVVSVCCMAYNHEKFIEDALEGFLIQETNFPYEVIINDDASTDNTANIIREYEKAYPHIIKPIYQKENQYSKGIDNLSTYQYPIAKGEFIALCEGDDYWIDKNKLQIQIDLLKKNPDINICSHNSQPIKNNKIISDKIFNKKTRVISTDEIIAEGGAIVHTCTIVFRKNILLQKYEFINIISYDYTLCILASLGSKLLALPDSMARHRLNSSENSFTSKMKKDKIAFFKFEYIVCNALLKLNEETNRKYERSIKTYIARRIYSLTLYINYSSYILKRKKIFFYLSFKQKIKTILLCIIQLFQKKYCNKSNTLSTTQKEILHTFINKFSKIFV